MKIAAPTTHTRTLIAIGVYTAVIILVIVAVIFPYSRTLVQQMAAYSTGQEQNRLLSDSIVKQQDAERAASTTLAEMQLDRSILPETKAITFIEELETIASDYGVEQTLSFLHTARQEKGTLVIIPITVRITGSWEQTNDYLIALEQSPIYINPERVAVSTEQGTDGASTIVFIQANTYWSGTQ